MRKTALVLFLSVSFYFLKSQAPGYMGRKTSIGYGFNINPAITAALLDYGTHVINTQHEFFIEHVVKKRLSLGLSLKLYKSTYNNTGETDVTYIYNSPPYTNYYIVNNTGYGSQKLATPYGKITIRARNFAVYAKIFGRKYVAPWGKYIQLGVTLNMRTCTYDPDEMRVTTVVQDKYYYRNTYTITYNDFGPTTQSYLYPDLLFGLGNSRIFGKHFVLDYGCNINTAAFILGVADAFDVYKPEPGKYIQVNSGMRVRGINRFNAFIKAAYLF